MQEILTRNRALEAENECLVQSLGKATNLNDAILRYSPAELIIVDREGRITGFSEAKARNSSRLPKLGDVMYRDYASGHVIDMYTELMDTIRNGTPKSFPEQPYGTRFLAITLSPFTDGAVIISRDVTGRKQAELALIKTEMEKNLILSSVSEILIYQDKDYRIRWANPAAAQALNRDIDSLIGETCFGVWWRRAIPCEGCTMHRVFTEGVNRQDERETPDGRIWNRRGYPVRDENGQVCGRVMVWVDITRQKETETEKKRIQSQLIQSQKMDAVGRLAGGVAHDFNNLLTAIIGGLDMILLKFNPDDPIYQELYEIFEASQRASELTRQLLLFSREHMPRFETVCLNDTITHLLKMLGRLIGEDITIETMLASGLQSVRADKGGVEQIIMNLVVNARDAMPQGGNVILSTENAEIDEKSASAVPDARPGTFVCLRVCDAGIGIPRESISRIFEPFFTTKKVGKGTGLGLSVVYGIVKQHDGWINVRSGQGKGTTFEIYLPAVADPVPRPVKHTVDSDIVPGNGERILIIEDEKIVRDFAVRALTKNGYEVYAAANGAEALEIFENQQGRFDLIFSDVVLPDMNGIELVDQFLSRDRDLRILISSGYTDTKSQWRVIRDKGYRFLQKPYALNDLFRAIRGGIDKK